MPRDLLLYFLAAVVLLNCALLLAVAIVRFTDVRERDAMRSAGSARPPRPRSVSRSGASVGRGAVESRGPGPAETLRSAAPREPILPPARASAGGEPRAAASMRRPRRFVLPKLEEDRARAERAIKAVLGETSLPSRNEDAAAHRPRRRSRRQRATGEGSHTAVDLSLRGLEALRTAVGAEAATRLAAAVASSVHAHVRSGDRMIDLGEGRLRLIVEADSASAEAAAERITALTAPWLAAALVPVTLRASIAAPAEVSVADVAAS